MRNILDDVAKEYNNTTCDVSSNVVHNVKASVNEDDNSKSIDCLDEKDDYHSGKTKKTVIVQSSIVANVRTRGNHIKKKKPLIYVTPSSTTPKKKSRKNV